MNFTNSKTARRVASRLLCLLLLGGAAPAAMAQGGQDTNIGYQRPPEAIAAIIEAPNTPSVSISAKGEWMLLLESPGYPSIEEVSAPESRLAGMRINPATNGPSRGYYYNGLKLKKVSNADEFGIKGLPQNARISNVSWSPDEKYVAFTNTKADGIELWLADLSTKEARKLTEAVVNNAY
ncbi:MAG: S9 family peptidase, partial [Pontibacter sp.]|nr:S9 family peptidase [Pontibacter sp.]